jgi:hypothetical protein
MTHQARAPFIAECDSVRWPPEPGDTVFFWTGDRLLRGILREVRHGVLWTDFLLEDRTIVDYNRMVMRPAIALWRNPYDISVEEKEAVKSRLKAAGSAGINIQNDPRLWSDFVQFLALMWLEVRKEREANLAALGDSGSDSKPS